MKITLPVAATLLFTGGLLAGYWVRDVMEPAAPGKAGPSLAGQAVSRSFDGGSAGRPDQGRGGRRIFGDGPQRRGGEVDGRDPEAREVYDRAAALSDLEVAFAAGDKHAAREALHRLSRPEGEALTEEQLRELSALLTRVDRDLIHDLTRALVISGGPQGLAMVMNFVEDEEQPLEIRRNALHGLSHLPEEKVDEVVPVLADFLESGSPGELQRAAAHAIGRLHEDSGVDVLLGLLGERPGVRSDVIFDAIGNLGRPEDVSSLLGLLGEDWNRHEKMSILRAAGEMSSRGEQGSVLLDLLRETPEGVSRSMVAKAISDSSHRLPSSFLSEALREVAGDRKSQEWIARALARVGGRKGLEALVDAAGDPEMKLDRQVLARALSEFRGRDATAVMMDLFRSSREADVLEPLARGIARSGDQESMRDLLSLLETGDSWQRRAVARSLEEGSGSLMSADRLLSMLQSERDPDVARSIARALELQHPRVMQERAAELFESSPSAVERIALAQILERQSTGGALRRIAEQLRREPDHRAQWEMARILGRQGDEGLRQMEQILRSEPDERRRHSMLWGLEASRSPGSARARSMFLELAASDPSPSIRAQAAEILGRQADPALITQLQALLAGESHADVQERILRAIRELGTR